MGECLVGLEARLREAYEASHAEENAQRELEAVRRSLEEKESEAARLVEEVASVRAEMGERVQQLNEASAAQVRPRGDWRLTEVWCRLLVC
jgi:DNA repair exonuclease SbcCD ATPase subunit